jgi:hypothetical protein
LASFTATLVWLLDCGFTTLLAPFTTTLFGLTWLLLDGAPFTATLFDLA